MTLPVTSKQFWMALWISGLLFCLGMGVFLMFHSEESSGAGLGLVVLGIVLFVSGFYNAVDNGWITFKQEVRN